MRAIDWFSVTLLFHSRVLLVSGSCRPDPAHSKHTTSINYKCCVILGLWMSFSVFHIVHHLCTLDSYFSTDTIAVSRYFWFRTRSHFSVSISVSASFTEAIAGRGIRPDRVIRCFRRRALFHFDVTVMTVRGAKSKSKSKFGFLSLQQWKAFVFRNICWFSRPQNFKIIDCAYYFCIFWAWGTQTK